MAYIGQGLNRFSNVEKLDVITPATSTGAGPYNLTKASVAFVPSSADTMVVSINGVVQYGNFTVSGSTITFSGALADADVCDFIYHMGTGFITTPVDNSVSTAKIVDSNITTTKINNSAVTNDKLAGSIANAKLSNSSITINGSAVSLGGSVTVGETKPTISSTNFTIPPSSATQITILGANFISIPQVQAIKTDGAIYNASITSFTNAGSINATFNLPNGTYYLRIENNDGNAVRTTNAILTCSVDPTFSTAAGSVGTIPVGTAGSALTQIVATESSGSTVTVAKTSGTFPTGISMNTSGVFSGTESSSTSTAQTFTFVITATDAEGQTATRTFTATVSVYTGLINGGQFN